MRHCNGCHQDRPESDYYRNHNKCRTCLVAQNRANRVKKREARRRNTIGELLDNWPRLSIQSPYRGRDE